MIRLLVLAVKRGLVSGCRAEEALRQEVTKKNVRVGVLEPGGVTTDLGSRNSGAMREDLDAFYDVLQAEDIADGVAYMVTRPRHASIAELWIMPTDQA